jgi:hypothetical protein
MKKAGRPRKNGDQPMWMLERATLVVFAYDRAREAGEKHKAAIASAVEFIRKKRPMMKICETEVRRILAEWRSKRSPVGLLITKPDPANCMFTLPDGQVVRRVLSASFGPRPVYARANAAEKREDRQ